MRYILLGRDGQAVCGGDLVFRIKVIVSITFFSSAFIRNFEKKSLVSNY